mmetsp:Transcript_119960/g.233507  ORF Transcript_119960/g.233507 Transcript_119960/m.233507 type:complete len:113 (+) Transcript_119960:388-726(+)
MQHRPLHQEQNESSTNLNSRAKALCWLPRELQQARPQQPEPSSQQEQHLQDLGPPQQHEEAEATMPERSRSAESSSRSGGIRGSAKLPTVGVVPHRRDEPEAGEGCVGLDYS